MALNIRGYKNLMANILFWKLNIIVNFRDLEFKFRNTGLGNNGASKLTVIGVTPELPGESITIPALGNIVQERTITYPKLPSREYVIYTELRGINLEKWNVRIPYALGNPNPDFNVANSPDSTGFRLEPGLGYSYKTELSKNKYFRGTQWRLFQRWYEDYQGMAFAFYDDSDEPFPSEPVSAVYNINSSELLRFSVRELYSKYQEHPYITLYSTNLGVDLTNRKFYNVVPIGIIAYKVKLELANGESVVRFFDTAWNPLNQVNLLLPEDRPVPDSNTMTLNTRTE